jgi:hypothetical protein
MKMSRMAIARERVAEEEAIKRRQSLEVLEAKEAITVKLTEAMIGHIFSALFSIVKKKKTIDKDTLVSFFMDIIPDKVNNVVLNKSKK